MAILKLQQEYLRNRDPEVLGQLWVELKSLGHFLIGKEKFHSQVTDTDARDLASSVCLRLMEGHEPVIKCAPSAYVKLALFYKGKEAQRRPLFFDEVKDQDRIPQRYDVHDVEMEALISAIMRDVVMPEDVRDTVDDILHKRISEEDAKAAMPRSDVWRLSLAMGRVKEYVRKSSM